MCRISEVFVKQKEIEQESRKLSNQTSRYAKQTKQWIQTIDSFNSALKVSIFLILILIFFFFMKITVGWRCFKHSCGLTFAFFIMRPKGTRRCAELGRGHGKRHASRYGNAGTCAQRFVVAEAIVQKRAITLNRNLNAFLPFLCYP